MPFYKSFICHYKSIYCHHFLLPRTVNKHNIQYYNIVPVECYMAALVTNVLYIVNHLVLM